MPKYLVLCNRHDSIYGDGFALFWGYRDSAESYTSDVRTAHRFDETEIAKFNDNQDIPILCSAIGVAEECTPESEMNVNTIELIERGKINELLGMKLRRC